MRIGRSIPFVSIPLSDPRTQYTPPLVLIDFLFLLLITLHRVYPLHHPCRCNNAIGIPCIRYLWTGAVDCVCMDTPNACERKWPFCIRVKDRESGYPLLFLSRVVSRCEWSSYRADNPRYCCSCNVP